MEKKTVHKKGWLSESVQIHMDPPSIPLNNSKVEEN